MNRTSFFDECGVRGDESIREQSKMRRDAPELHEIAIVIRRIWMHETELRHSFPQTSQHYRCGCRDEVCPGRVRKRHDDAARNSPIRPSDHDYSNATLLHSHQAEEWLAVWKIDKSALGVPAVRTILLLEAKT